MIGEQRHVAIKAQGEHGHRRLRDKWKSPVVSNEVRGWGVGPEMKGQLVDWPPRQKDRVRSWIRSAGGPWEAVTDGCKHGA